MQIEYEVLLPRLGNAHTCLSQEVLPSALGWTLASVLMARRPEVIGSVSVLTVSEGGKNSKMLTLTGDGKDILYI